MNNIWCFRKPNPDGKPTVEITVELRADNDHLGAYAEDSYYYGDLTREESLDLAQAVLAKLSPAPFKIGAHARVVDGPMCGADGFVVGHLLEDGQVVLQCREGLLLQPASFVRAT